MANPPSPLASPPADPEIARRLLATTAFVIPAQAVLESVVPWSLHEAKLAIHESAERVEVLTFTIGPERILAMQERVLRSSGARWDRPHELPEPLASEARRQLDAWRRAGRRTFRSASILARAEHGYRMAFRSARERIAIDLAVTPPRIVDEMRAPIPEPARSIGATLRCLGRASWTLIAGGGEPS